MGLFVNFLERVGGLVLEEFNEAFDGPGALTVDGSSLVLAGEELDGEIAFDVLAREFVLAGVDLGNAQTRVAPQNLSQLVECRITRW